MNLSILIQACVSMEGERKELCEGGKYQIYAAYYERKDNKDGNKNGTG